MNSPTPKFDLSLPLSKSFLEDIEITEEINEERLLKILNSDILIEDYKNHLLEVRNLPNKNKKLLPPYETEQKHLLKIYEDIKNNHVLVKLNKTRSYGRLYPKDYNSLICLRYEIRNILTYGIYKDLDLKNCFPTILNQLCKYHNIPTPYLNEYIECRKEKINYYNELFNIKNSKKLFIAILHGATEQELKYIFKIKNNLDDYLKNYLNEINEICDELKLKYSHIREYILKKKPNNKNINGSFIAYVIQEIELKIIEITFTFLNKKYNIPIESLIYCYDGFLIKIKYFNNDLINDINKYIFDVTTFKIEFEEKIIKNDSYDLINKIELTEEQKNKFVKNQVGSTRGIITTKFINKIKYILDTLPNDFYENFENWYKIGCLLSKLNNRLDNEAKDIFKTFSEKSKDWDTRHKNNFNHMYNNIENNKHKNKFTLKKLFEISGDDNIYIDYGDIIEEIYKEVEENIIIEPISGGKNYLYKVYNKDLGYWDEGENFYNLYIMQLCFDIADKHEEKRLRSTKIIKDVSNSIKLEISCKFDKYKVFNSQAHLLPFKNGVYDLINSIFRKPNKTDYISNYINYDFKNISNDEIEKSECFDMIKKIFVDPEIREYALKCYGTALIGENIQKIFCCSGKGGNGKSCIQRFIKYSLGIFALEGNEAILSEASKTGATVELAQLSNKRFASFSEPTKSKPFNNEILKKLTGGSDIVARGLYSDVTNLNNHLSLFIEANFLPKLKTKPGEAEFRRFELIPFKSEFRPDYEDDEQNLRFKANNKIDSKTWQENNKLYLINMLIPYAKRYLETNKIEQPESVKNEIKNYFISCDNLSEWLTTILIYNPDIKKNDSITIKKIYDEIYKQSDIYINQSFREKAKDNFKNFIEKLGCDLEYGKFINKNSDKVWIINNHKLKEENELINEEDE